MTNFYDRLEFIVDGERIAAPFDVKVTAPPEPKVGPFRPLVTEITLTQELTGDAALAFDAFLDALPAWSPLVDVSLSFNDRSRDRRLRRLIARTGRRGRRGARAVDLRRLAFLARGGDEAGVEASVGPRRWV